MHATLSTILRSHRAALAIGLVGALATAAIGADQTTFKSPQLAMRALVEAAAKDDTARLRQIFGPAGDEIVSSGDPVEDKTTAKRFVAIARERTVFEPLRDGTVVARLGKEDWPFPVPMVKAGSEWHFDAAAGKDEILNRRIGRNEMIAIDVCRAYVDAQLEYAKVDRTGAGVRTYAQKVRSEVGKKDGLYWDDPSGKNQSPLGPLIAEATAEGYGPGAATDGGPRPYHGYVYRILTAQGARAAGGARSYLQDGKMTGGFALIAYPAEYGVSGIMTFLVNQNGIVLQKNLGEKTAEIAKGMSAYDPDDSWDPAG